MDWKIDPIPADAEGQLSYLFSRFPKMPSTMPTLVIAASLHYLGIHGRRKKSLGLFSIGTFFFF